MPTYKVTDPSSGKTVRLTGDSAPTEQELEKNFKNVGILSSQSLTNKGGQNLVVERNAILKNSPLSEQHRQKLDGIVSKMEANGEKTEDIQFVVNDYKSKYGQATPPAIQLPHKNWFSKIRTESK